MILRVEQNTSVIFALKCSGCDDAVFCGVVGTHVSALISRMEQNTSVVFALSCSCRDGAVVCDAVCIGVGT